ncbi:MAG TPA: thymidine phosphorylase [Candidatus Nitrosotenuis sp.]|jgi:pyrimidine-nucleoside phosphorylase|nr:thymidine phosphorylase [Candidatus Nitrosotenuis sp.]
MTPYHIILRKRNGETLTEEEIRYLVGGFVAGEVHDYQMAAWMMAVWFRGLSPEELVFLTRAMIDSGDQVDLSGLPGVKVDKHSTGGVGDTVTLVLAPLAAAAGAVVAKMSGRGLGHTGGTLDKLESVPGLRVDLTMEQFLEQLRRVGAAVISPTSNLVPADGKMYALRDVTATVDSIPLIASSIMSKKLACGADCILLDVKFGRGAFMERYDDARCLAQTMAGLGRGFGRKVRCVLTDMDQPLGRSIGNALEVREAIETLKGQRAGSALEEVACELTAHLLEMAGLLPDLEAARRKVRELLESGAGARKLAEILEAQGGDPRVVEDPDLLPAAPLQAPLRAEESGWIGRIDALAVGRAALELGCGRKRKGDPVDPAVGIVFLRRPGDRVEKGETVAVLHARREPDLHPPMAILREALQILPVAPRPEPLIREVVE